MTEEIILRRVNGWTAAIDEPHGTTIHVIAQRPRRRDFFKVLRGKWEPRLVIRSLGIGQFVSPEGRKP